MKNARGFFARLLALAILAALAAATPALAAQDAATLNRQGMSALNSENYARAAALFREAADQGYAYAQFYLGYMYACGLGMKEDFPQAAYWYGKAADQGHEDAKTGRAYLRSQGVVAASQPTQTAKPRPPSASSATLAALTASSAPALSEFGEIKAKAEQGQVAYQFALARMYETGEGTARNTAEAERWYGKAASGGHAGAKDRLTAMKGGEQPQPVTASAQNTTDAEIIYLQAKAAYDSGNYSEALKHATAAAEVGHAGGQNILGVMYHNGYGVKQDDAQAVAWFRKAADQGFAQAQSNLGVMYDNGRGVQQDEAQAVAWYRKAAEQGNESAKASLASRGITVASRPASTGSTAVASTSAAPNLYAEAKTAYDSGDYRKAHEVLYKIAKDNGDSNAMFILAVMYEAGDGVKPDVKQAAEWYRKAADKGNADAMASLALMYEEGRGVAKSPAKAMEFKNKAAAAGGSALLGQTQVPSAPQQQQGAAYSSPPARATASAPARSSATVASQPEPQRSARDKMTERAMQNALSNFSQAAMSGAKLGDAAFHSATQFELDVLQGFIAEGLSDMAADSDSDVGALVDVAVSSGILGGLFGF